MNAIKKMFRFLGDKPNTTDSRSTENNQSSSSQTTQPSTLQPKLQEQPASKVQKAVGFEGLGLSQQALHTLGALGYSEPTPIQKQSIPFVMEGRDVLACAQTGTGKTAAFALPSIEILDKSIRTTQRHPQPRALVLTPTRELAVQVFDSFQSYGRWANLRCLLLVGGVNDAPQIRQLKAGVDVIVATPGRMLDLMNRGFAHIGHVEILVLDEADRMLDMGFLPDVKRIVKKTPDKKQTLFFSATFPKEIESLANELLKNPARVAVAPQSTASENVKQFVYFVDQKEKSNLLLHLLKDETMNRVIVFSRTKHGANRLCRALEHAKITCAPIHSNKSQNARLRALDDFKKGSIRVLVASDIAARGLDVDDITHVVNFDLPEVAETYVHRIGRTGRAGALGVALSFCSNDEKQLLSQIEKIMKKSVDRVTEHPFNKGVSAMPVGAVLQTNQQPRQQQNRQQPRGQQRPQHQRPNGGQQQQRSDARSQPSSQNRDAQQQNNQQPRPAQQQRPQQNEQRQQNHFSEQPQPSQLKQNESLQAGESTGAGPNQHPRHRKPQQPPQRARYKKGNS